MRAVLYRDLVLLSRALAPRTKYWYPLQDAVDGIQYLPDGTILPAEQWEWLGHSRLMYNKTIVHTNHHTPTSVMLTPAVLRKIQEENR